METTSATRPAIGVYNSGFPEGADLVRLHLNETPYGQPRAALDAAAAELGRRCAVYPDSDAADLRARLADHLGLEAAMVAVGNGVDELVLLTALALLGPGRTALVTDTTFPGYRSAAAAVGAEVRAVPLADHRVSPAALADALREDPTISVVFVCNPVNPTGTVLDRAGVERIAADAEAVGAVAVFDEAYLDFAGPAHDHALALARAGRPVLVLRTFSKAWGLAALRVGYAAGPADLVARILDVRHCLPFNTNRLAQRAAAAALDDADFLTRVRERTNAVRRRLYQGLDELGLPYVPSVTNFVLVHTGGDSTAVAHRLAAEHRVLVRDLTAFGLPGSIRVTLGTAEEIDVFCEALGAVLFGREVRRDAAARDGLARGRGASPRREAVYRGTGHWNLPVPTLPAQDPAAMFNGYVGAHAVFALRQLGVWDRLLDGPAAAGSLIAETGARPALLHALLRTASVLGLLTLDDGVATLTDAGRETARQRGFFTWAVGGYGEVLATLAAQTVGEESFGTTVRRDEALVAAGSSEAGRLMGSAQADVLAGITYDSVADIGSGDGRRLIGLCQGETPRRGLGLDISAAACAVAAKEVAGAGLSAHVDIVCADIFSGDDRPVFPGIDLVTCFLMLHDLFAAMPGPEVVRSLRRAFPDARYFLIADTVIQPWEELQGPPPVFSAAFELVHAFMGVPLQQRETYERAFADGGLEIARRVELPVPSTWLYLLRVPEEEPAR